MALGQIYTIPSGSARLVVAQSHTDVPSIGVLNPNDGVVYLKLNAPAGPTPTEWDWKLPSQSYGFFPGPWTSLGVYFLDQSGSNRSGEINVYESRQKFADIPNIQAIGRAIQAAGTSVDISVGPKPQNPPANTGRLWIDSNGDLHLLDSAGGDATVIDSTNYGTYIVPGGDVQGTMAATLVRSVHLNTGDVGWIKNTSLVDKRWLQYTNDGYTSFHAGDTGLLFANQANTVRLLTVDNGGGGVVLPTGGLTISAGNFAVYAPAGTSYGNQIYKNAGPINAGVNFNDGSHLNLQSPDGYSPRIGFHMHGVVGWTLYITNDANNPLRIISNAGGDYAFATTTGVQTLTNKVVPLKYVADTTGQIAGYGYNVFHVLSVGGGAWYLPNSSGHAGEMLVFKNWTGGDVSINCQYGNVFGAGGQAQPTQLILHSGDAYTVMSDGGMGWMII